jgi:hypothetical protein
VAGLDEVILRIGFHGYQPDDGIRGTTGNAYLPVNLFGECPCPIIVELVTAGYALYLDEGVPVAA